MDNRGRMNDNDIYWKGQKHVHIQIKKNYTCGRRAIFCFLSSKANNDLLDFDIMLIKFAAPFNSKSLSRIINDSLLQGRVHTDWKRARVSPVYNGEGDLDFEGNYRTISVIGYIDRLESLVCSQIIHYLEKSWFHIPWPICVSQTTLYSNYSLHRVIDDWLENINVGEWRVHTFWTYLSVFDSIKHDILLKKLEMYGFQDVELTWFKSYLHNRQ